MIAAQVMEWLRRPHPEPPPPAVRAWLASIDRGPWWWRARCRLADMLGSWACAVDPEDRSSDSFWDGRSDHIYFETVRRR